MSYRLARLPGGREVGMTGLGDPAGYHLAVFFHPTPGASGFDPDPSVTDRSGVHVIGFDRPGYGSTAPDDVGVAEWADEVAAWVRSTEAGADAATQTQYGRIHAIGWREGGIYAAALADRHPEILDAVVLIGAPTPERAARGAEGGAGAGTGGGGVAAGVATAADIAAEPLGYQDRLGRMLEDAMIQGDIGIRNDRAAFADPALQPPRVELPALILYGAADPYATVTDAQWYASRMSRARVERVDGGADAIARSWERALAFLREQESDGVDNGGSERASRR